MKGTHKSVRIRKDGALREAGIHGGRLTGGIAAPRTSMDHARAVKMSPATTRTSPITFDDVSDSPKRDRHNPTIDEIERHGTVDTAEFNTGSATI